MKIVFDKFKMLGLIFISISISMGSAFASPTDDLVTAVRKVDLERIQKALQQGGDPNVLVCYHAIDKFIYPANSEDCSKATKSRDSSPLIWAVGSYYKYSLEEKAPAVENLLVKAGAKSKIYSVNLDTGATVNASDKHKDFLLSWFFSYPLPPLSVERAMTFAKAGYAPSEEQLKSLSESMESDLRVGNNSTYTAKRNFLEAIESSDFSSERCKITFERASSIDDFQKFIKKFQSNDSCNLVSQAKEKLIKLVSQEKQRRNKEEKEEQARQKSIIAFRKSISGGEDTNCGPVIEVKGKMVKVSFAVQNYGTEHWIKRDQLFPAGYACNFYNGNYQPPK